MIAILTLFTYISTILTIGVYLFFLLINLLPHNNSFTPASFTNVAVDLNNCKNAGMICVAVAWFYASCQSQNLCREYYSSIGSTCERLGMIWIIFTFLTVILSVVYGITKKSVDLVQISRNLRKSGFWAGIIFMAASIILGV